MLSMNFGILGTDCVKNAAEKFILVPDKLARLTPPLKLASFRIFYYSSTGRRVFWLPTNQRGYASIEIGFDSHYLLFSSWQA